MRPGTLVSSVLIAGATCHAGATIPPAGASEKYPGTGRVMEYIRKSFPLTVRVQKEDSGDIIGLPYPYNSPCANDAFHNLYVWDTYFINLGLLRLGMLAQAKNNTDDMLFLVEKLGFVPNANRHSMANRSGLPFLPLMVRDIFAATKDRAWLKSAYATLVKEHDFWMTQRMSPTGLNRIHHSATQKYLKGFYNYLVRERFKNLALTDDAEKTAFGSQSLSECEVWDFTPRFDRHAEDFCPVEINANLYLGENILADLAKVLDNGEESAWRKQAAARKALIQEYLWNETVGCYTDYDFANGKKSDLVSCAALFPLLAGVATQEQAELVVCKMRHLLEYDHGLSTCEKRPGKFVYQWDFPNGWAPLQCVAIQALDRYGFKDDAGRIAEKYVRTVIANFEKTGDLWEKYNVVTGTIDVADEYKMPSMIGWTAGAFVFASEYLENTSP